MHAIRLHAFGPPANLRYEEVAEPSPGAGQVRIAVRAAGVHLLDTVIRSGRSGGPFALPELPTIPGREVAGIVEAASDGGEAWVGRRVVAHLGEASGGYAELAVCDAQALLAVPDGLADEAAVAMVGTGRTALGLLEVADLQPDDVVLVTAAAGGIGTLALQGARRAGATVVGAAGGTEKVGRVRELGADVAVDYDAAGWPEEVRAALGGGGVTVVLDGVGGERGRAAFELLAPGGRIILYGWSSGEPTPIAAADLYARGLSATAALGPRMLGRPGGIRGLAEAALAEAGAGRLVPVVGQRFALADAAAAHEALESRLSVGKVVLLCG
jgi:NADPH:quinone reductase